MFSKSIIWSLRFPIFLLFIICFCLGGGLLLYLIPSYFFVKDEKAILLGISLILTLYLIVDYNFTIYIPLKKLKNAEDKLIDTDLKFFNVALSEFSRGNLTIQVPDVSACKLDISRYSRLREFEERYNLLHAQMIENSRDFNIINSEPCERLYYVGADSYLEGERCGKIMGELLKGTGEVAILVYSLTNTGQYLRRKGFTNLILKEYPEIRIVEVSVEERKPELTHSLTCELAHKYPQLKGIYIAEGNTPAASAKALKELGITNKVKIITHDITAQTAVCLREGSIAATLSQNPYAQGYNPVILLYNYLINNEVPMINRYLTFMEEITQKNLSQHWSDGQRQILSQQARQVLVTPLKNERQSPYKILVILPARTNFWKPVEEGVLAAAEVLKHWQTEVRAVIPPSIGKGDFSAESFKTSLEELMKEPWHAIALPLFDHKLVPYLNDLNRQGIKIATLNSEPVNFRGLISTVFNHTRQLFAVGEDLATSSTQTSQSTTVINNSMQVILSSIQQQTEQIKNTKTCLEKLLNNVTNITAKSAENIQSVDNTRSTAESGSHIVRESYTALETVLNSARTTNMIIQLLNDHAMKIQSMTDLIDDIANRTAVIAINASILSARAGAEGLGFAVVATEIRQLADRANDSTRAITELVKNTLDSIYEATHMVAQEMEDINRVTEYAAKAEKALQAIEQATEESRKTSDAIVLSVEEMKQFSARVSDAMGELIKINAQNNQALKEIAQATTDMNQQVNYNNRVAIDLATLAQSQEDLVAQFMVRKARKSE